jgi:TatD DNase family protein
MIDSHAHLNDERLFGRVGEILSAMAEFGVESVVCVGYDGVSSERAVLLAEKYPCKIFAAAAFHPHDAKNYAEKDGEIFRAFAAKKQVVAIGETGLDYYYDLSPREDQRRIFAAHLELADEVKLPVIVHVRDAYQDTLEILRTNKKYLNNGILIHNFSGDAEIMGDFDDFDCYYSFGGTLTFKNNKKSIEAFLKAKKSRVLLETDCPYLTPEPHRGKLNFPHYVKYVAERGAALLGMEYGEIDELTTANTKEFFRI